MNKTIIAILGFLVLGTIVFFLVQKDDTDSQSVDQTIELMGIEMTQSQAEEHCQLMPDMEGCGPYIK